MTLFLLGALKGTVLVTLGLVATRLLRSRAAALRHWLLAAALACGAATPVLQLIVPTWFALDPIETVYPGARAQALRGSAAAAIAGSEVTTVESASPPDRLPPPPGPWIWAAGAGMSLLLMAVGFIRLWSLARTSQLVESGPWRSISGQLAREYGVAAPRILHSHHPALLVTWGIRRARIILPASAPHWTEERIRIVLAHEMAHIRRRDWAVQMAAEIVRCIYWFNPIVWIACARLRQHSEEACDDIVLREGIQGPEYAEHLLELARMFKRHRTAWLAAPAIARPSGLERRIAAMLDSGINRSPLTAVRRVMIAAALVAITTLVAGLAVFAQAAPARFAGTVYDPTGAPLPDVTVSLTNASTGVTRAVPSDQSGYFDLADVPPGSYTLEVKGVAFKTIDDEVTLAPGSATRRDFRMTLGSVQETITVSGPHQPRTVGPTLRAYPSLAEVLDGFRGKRVQPPLKLKDVRPVYSQALRDAGVEGIVMMRGRITADGSVAGMQVLSSPNADLSRAALEAVNEWQFEPTRLWGTPVDVEMNVTVNFRREQ
jgi:TonB family protein